MSFLPGTIDRRVADELQLETELQCEDSDFAGIRGPNGVIIEFDGHVSGAITLPRSSQSVRSCESWRCRAGPPTMGAARRGRERTVSWPSWRSIDSLDDSRSSRDGSDLCEARVSPAHRVRRQMDRRVALGMVGQK